MRDRHGEIRRDSKALERARVVLALPELERALARARQLYPQLNGWPALLL